MSNVTNNSAAAAAITNFGLLNQLMSSIGGVHANIVSSNQYNRGPPLLLRYYYKLMIRERIRQIVKEVLNGTLVRISSVLLLYYVHSLLLLLLFLFDKEKIDIICKQKIAA